MCLSGKAPRVVIKSPFDKGLRAAFFVVGQNPRVTLGEIVFGQDHPCRLAWRGNSGSIGI